MENLRRIDSLPLKRVEMLKDALVLIKDFSSENGLDTDVFQTKTPADHFVQVLYGPFGVTCLPFSLYQHKRPPVAYCLIWLSWKGWVGSTLLDFAQDSVKKVLTDLPK